MTPRAVIFLGWIIVREAAAQINAAICRDESSWRLFQTGNCAAAQAFARTQHDPENGP